MSKTILNIAAGKLQPLELKNEDLRETFIVDVDPMYLSHTDPAIVENNWKEWTGQRYYRANVKMDAFEFMERTIMHFDKICIYRFLEHIPFDKVPYFIYLISTITRPGAIVDVIVPNYKLLAKMLLEEDDMLEDDSFEAHNILLTTELLNEPSCPHASIWTPTRADYFWSLEGRFRTKNYDDRFEFDGRDIYLRFFAERI